MASLLAAAPELTTGDSVELTGPCTIYNRGTHGGCGVVIEMAREDVEASFVAEHTFHHPGQYNIEAKGTYFVRARTTTGGASTSITVDAEQDA